MMVGTTTRMRLHANAGKSFQGSIVLGMGFTFDDTDKKGIASPITRARAEELAKSGERPISMEELIDKDPATRSGSFRTSAARRSTIARRMCIIGM